MAPVVGVFTSRATAEQCVAQLKSNGIAADKINLLTPETTKADLEKVSTNQGEQPGMVKTMGAVAGGAVGLGLGEMVASLLVPGVGPVLAIGLAAGAIVGALSGGTIGGAMEKSVFKELPEDDLFIYEDALRQKRSVVIAIPSDDAQKETIAAILERGGAESIDQAHKVWWLGMRSVEKEKYEASGAKFDQDEGDFQAGFESALNPANHNRSGEEAWVEAGRKYSNLHAREPFLIGYSRGRAYLAQAGRRKNQAA